MKKTRAYQIYVRTIGNGRGGADCPYNWDEPIEALSPADAVLRAERDRDMLRNQIRIVKVVTTGELFEVEP